MVKNKVLHLQENWYTMMVPINTSLFPSLSLNYSSRFKAMKLTLFFCFVFFLNFISMDMSIKYDFLK